MKLYHYTRLENLTSIVQREKLSFWLTDYREFDDTSEGEFILKIQKQFYPNCVYNNIERYILSLCKRNNNLPMWKEYASNATGVALEIETDNIPSSSFCQLLPCIYNQEIVKERSEAINSIIERYRLQNVKDKYVVFSKHYPELDPIYLKDFFEKTDVWDACVELIRVKNACYSYEEEFRYIVKAWDDNFHYYFKNGKLRCSYEYNISKNALTKIYVGPNNSKDIVYNIKHYLQLIGLKDIDVEIIDLPYIHRGYF